MKKILIPIFLFSSFYLNGAADDAASQMDILRKEVREELVAGSDFLSWLSQDTDAFKEVQRACENLFEGSSLKSHNKRKMSQTIEIGVSFKSFREGNYEYIPEGDNQDFNAILGFIASQEAFHTESQGLNAQENALKQEAKDQLSRINISIRRYKRGERIGRHQDDHCFLGGIRSLVVKADNQGGRLKFYTNAKKNKDVVEDPVIDVPEEDGLISVQKGASRFDYFHEVNGVQNERISLTWRFFSKEEIISELENYDPSTQRMTNFIKQIEQRKVGFAQARKLYPNDQYPVSSRDNSAAAAQDEDESPPPPDSLLREDSENTKVCLGDVYDLL